MNSSDRIYYDINMINNSNKNKIINFKETKNTPILSNPDLYDMSVIRFSADTSQLPLFIPDIDFKASDPYHETKYNFKFRLHKADETIIVGGNTNILWAPQNKNKQKMIGDPYKLIESGYYNCYNINYFIQLINDQINDAFTIFKNANGLNTDFKSPFFEFDVAMQSFNLLADERIFNQNKLHNEDVCFLDFNNIFFNLFYTLNAIRDSANDSNEFIIRTNMNYMKTNIFVINTDTEEYSAIVLNSEGSSIDSFNPIENIVFTTSLLAIEPNMVSQSSSFEDNNSILHGGNNHNFNIISDIRIQSTGRGILEYLPNFPRIITMKCNQSALKSIDISVWYVTRYGVMLPLETPPSSTTTLKIMFIKKSI
jgi:hypothetical protein